MSSLSLGHNVFENEAPWSAGMDLNSLLSKIYIFSSGICVCIRLAIYTELLGA